MTDMSASARSCTTSTSALGRVLRGDAALLVARLVLGPTFLVMGQAKIADPVAFLKLVREYDLVPVSMPWLLNVLAVGLPWLEVVCGALLLLGVALRGAALTVLGMLLMFTVAIVLRALSIQAAEGVAFCSIAFDCGCGSGEVFVCSKIPQNLGLMFLAAVALLSRSCRFCLWPTVVGEPEL